MLCDLEGGGDVAAAIAVPTRSSSRPEPAGLGRRAQGDGGPRRRGEADRGGQAKGIPRYLIVSSMGADKAPETAAGGFGAYLRAKFEADEAVRASGLDYTIVRPGGLTDDPGTGQVRIADTRARPDPARRRRRRPRRLPRQRPSTIGKSFDLISGDTPIADALP